MTRKPFAVLAFLCLLAGTPARAELNDADRTHFNDEISRLEQQADRAPFFKRVMEPRSSDELIYAMDYLQARILGRAQSKDFRYVSPLGIATEPTYHVAYSTLLWSIGIKDSSMAMAAAAMLIAETDRARCADKTAGQDFLRHLAQSVWLPLEQLQGLAPEAREPIISVALMSERAISERLPNRAICLDGMGAMQQALKLQEQGRITVITAKSKEGNTHTFTDSADIKVEYVSGDEWNRERERIRGEFLRRMLGK